MNPKFNLSPKVRIGIYIFTAIGTPIVMYLRAIGAISDMEVALWSAEVSVAAGLAAINVDLGAK